ncbi:MAG TPA: DUF1570 domain-containing protein [Isosphaeraceae bacterium]|nr:DUF1570 domain-containing protein [Isosphaeraceae bacterium]
MEPVVIARNGCGEGCCVRLPEVRPPGVRGRSVLILTLAASFELVVGGVDVAAQVRAGPDSPRETAPQSKGLAAREPRSGPSRPGAKPGPVSSSLVAASAPAKPATAVAKPTAPQPIPVPARRFRIRDESGHCVVARLHGQYRDQMALMQPDGQLGFPTLLVPTDEPFLPITAEELRARLQKGPYADYRVLTTRHYLIFYQSNTTFAEKSGGLLEDLYQGLIEVCRKRGIPVHDAEFPLVAVIFATEDAFRAHQEVAPEVQAYYEIFTNRIYFYQQSDRDLEEPKVTALRKPQTVAHEGVHQILSNIGVQPRISAWPLWLIEGLAEYCATPATTKKGVAWDRPGMINALHMATLRELDDPLANPVAGPGARANASRQAPFLCQAESLIRKSRLTPTDYAQAWALTHYLNNERGRDFVEFLKAMSQMPPLAPRTPEDHLAEFRKFFGDDLAKLDKKVDKYIRELNRRRFDHLPFYAVMVEQPLGGSLVRRLAWISQSPQMIQEQVQELSSPQGGILNWWALPFASRAQAELVKDDWIRGY